MRRSMSVLTASLMSLGLVACGETATASPADVEGLRAQAIAAVVANPDCELFERERQTEVVDLSDGDTGFIVDCSAGMVDVWRYLYVSDNGGAPVRAGLIQYDVRGDGRWRTDDATSELTWDGGERVFKGVVRHQASGCASGADWRWTGDRIALVKQWAMDCSAIGDDGELPEPATVWPTTPATPEPTPDNSQD
jgi:hypothetical protein